MVYTITPAAFSVLTTRAALLRKPEFPQPLGSQMADEMDAIVADGVAPDRFVIDLAIVASRHAQAFDRNDSGDYCYQEKFRKQDFLEEQMLYRRNVLRKRQLLLNSITQDGRPLTPEERATFIAMHQNCRHVCGQSPLLRDKKMDEYLDTVIVRSINLRVDEVGFHGISSFDGKFVYVVLTGADPITVPHEMEHNIRRFVAASDLVEQARLVSPEKDPTLQVDGVQCESGFVSEHHFHKKQPYIAGPVPLELVSPFSARWNRRAFR